MRVEFKLPQSMIGFAAETVVGGTCEVITTEALTSFDDKLLTWRLELLHEAILNHVPGLPPPSMLDNILVIIRTDLTAVAYINDLAPRARVRANIPVETGQTVFVRDITEITSLDIGVEIPPDCAFILIRSFGWRRSLFYDLSPLHPTSPLRQFDVPSALARQAMQLIKGSFSEDDHDTTPTNIPPQRLQSMADGFAELTRLLGQRCQDEKQYQELFQSHPWIFGGSYKRLDRHLKFDDTSIPDFTALRHHDNCHDIIELKQPFLNLFRQNGDFSSEFNDAWNQTERYLTFARRNRDYLRSQKGLLFENPKCLLIIGYRLNEQQIRAMRDKEALNPAISILTYDQVAAIAQALLGLTSDMQKLELAKAD